MEGDSDGVEQAAAPAFATSQDDSAVVLAVVGDLDLAASEPFGVALENLRPLAAPLTLDLREVGFVDSSGLRALLLARESALADTGVPPQFHNVPAQVLRLIAAAGLTEFLNLA